MGGPKVDYKSIPTPVSAPLPTPAPMPSPTPTRVEATTSAADRRKRLQSMRYGMLSTIKSAPRGISGTGSDLYGGTGKQTLGA